MRGRVLMKKFCSTEASMIMRVLIYNLFVLFRNEVLGVEERSKRLLTLRYKYFVMGGMMRRDGSKIILISQNLSIAITV